MWEFPLVKSDVAEVEGASKETVKFRCSKLEMLDLFNTLKEALHRVKNIC